MTASPGTPVVSPQIARTIIEDADLFFVGGHAIDPIDIAIKNVERGWATHCGLFLRGAGDSVFTLESTFLRGVHQGKGATYLEGGDGRLVICRLTGMTPDAASALIARGRQLIGRRYEVGEEIAMALHRLWNGVPVHPEWQELFCSGFLQDVCRGTPWQMAMDVDGGNATPEDILSESFVAPVCAVRMG